MDKINNVYKDKKDCCGCACCVNICPKQAIYMQADKAGYLYPIIDKTKCINCGMCRKSCAYQREGKNKSSIDSVYGSIAKDLDLVTNSASGGVFANIARNFIRSGGVVYGSAMNYKNGELKVEHVRINREEELIKLQGSKYVQSSIENCYKDIKKDIREDKKILFSGTPCQNDAVKTYLEKEDTTQVYYIDIICHGVPNNKMFNDYIKMLEEKYKGKVIDFKFRDKTRNWGLNAAAIIEKKGKIMKKIIPSYDSSYYQLFLDSEIYRENCYFCPYANSNRIGDITIGDFWKVEKENKEELKEKNINIDNGVSCILISTENGNELFKKYGSNLNSFKSDFKKVSNHNTQLIRPSLLVHSREDIIEKYKINGYKDIDNYYWKKNLKKIVLKKCWYRLPLKVRSKLSNM